MFFFQLSRTQLIANTLYLNRDESQLFADSCAVCANHCRCRRLIHLLFTFYFRWSCKRENVFTLSALSVSLPLSFPLSIHLLWKPQSSLRENPNIVNIFVSILLILFFLRQSKAQKCECSGIALWPRARLLRSRCSFFQVIQHSRKCHTNPCGFVTLRRFRCRWRWMAKLLSGTLCSAHSFSLDWHSLRAAGAPSRWVSKITCNADVYPTIWSSTQFYCESFLHARFVTVRLSCDIRIVSVVCVALPCTYTVYVHETEKSFYPTSTARMYTVYVDDTHTSDALKPTVWHRIDGK